MYRLLIVDDEQGIADGMYEVFSENKDLDVYRVYSAIDALSILEKIRIDLALIDIQMPGMNGLQLLKEIKDTWSFCYVIILTGHDKFEFIYQANKYTNVKYLLKNEGYYGITKAVEQAVFEIEEQTKSADILFHAKQQLQSLGLLMKKDFLYSLIKGDPKVLDTHYSMDFSMNIDFSRMLILVVGRATPRESEGYSNHYSEVCEIGEAITSGLSAFCRSEMYIDAKGILYLFMQPRENEDNDTSPRFKSMIKGNLEKIQEQIEAVWNFAVSFAIGHTPVSSTDIPEEINRLENILYFNMDVNAGAIICELGQPVVETDKLTDQIDEEPFSKAFLIEQLADQLENGNTQQYFSLLDELTSALTDKKSTYSLVVKEVYLSIALVLLNCINRRKLLTKLAFQCSVYKLTNIEEHDSVKEAFNYLKQVSVQVFQIINEKKEEKASQLVDFMKKYIVSHLHEPDKLTLMNLSDLVYFNPAYLSRLFKQLTGANLTDYIIEERIKRAKEMLQNPAYKIQEISEATGYSTPTNFTRRFRQIVGVSPNDYRRNNSIQN